MIEYFEKNETGRDFVVGDIHGCFDLLEEKLLDLKFDDSKDRLFSVGDLIDRGKQSEDCLLWLDKPWFHAVIGNHENMAIMYSKQPEDLASYYIRNGGAWFVGLSIVEQQTYLNAFESMPYLIEIKTKTGIVGIVHAECPYDHWGQLKENITFNTKTQEQALWSRDKINYCDSTLITGLEKLYVGHSPVDEPTTYGNTIYLDTGAVFNDGYLSVVQI